MKKKFKFQMENGHIYEGAYEIAIRDHIAEIDENEITTAVKHLIEAHGGYEIKVKVKLSPKRKTKPVEWSDKKEISEVK